MGPLRLKKQWHKLEAVQTISAKSIPGTPSYVRNEITLSTAKLKKLKILIRPQLSSIKTNGRDTATLEN